MHLLHYYNFTSLEHLIWTNLQVKEQYIWIYNKDRCSCVEPTVLCGYKNFCENSAERKILIPLSFFHTVYICVCACMHNLSDGVHACSYVNEPLYFRENQWELSFKHDCGFSQVSVSLSFLLCVFKWMGSKNPNIRSPLPHLPLSFYLLHLSFFHCFSCACAHYHLHFWCEWVSWFALLRNSSVDLPAQ